MLKKPKVWYKCCIIPSKSLVTCTIRCAYPISHSKIDLGGVISVYIQLEYSNILMLRLPLGFENHPRWWYPKIYHTRAYGPLVIYFWISSPWMIFKPLGISEHQNVLVFSLHIHSYQPRLRLGWYEKNIALGPSVLVRYFWYHTPRSILPCDIT